MKTTQQSPVDCGESYLPIGGPIPSDPEPRPLQAPRVVIFFRGEEVDANTVAPLASLLAPKCLERQQLSRDEIDLLAPLPAHRLIQAVPLERLKRLHEVTRRSPYRRGLARVNLANMRVVEPPAALSAARLVALLSRLPEVALAYVERDIGRPCDTTACAGLTDLSADQRWLEPGPDGLAAHFVWGLSGGKGENIPFILIDMGWNIENNWVCHCDLSGGIGLAWGVNGSEGHKQHGMASLGLAVARHDRGGILGVAPSAAPVSVCSYAGSPGSLSYLPEIEAPDTIPSVLINPWNALAISIDRLRLAAGLIRPVPGVILLELQVEAPSASSAWSPAEAEPALRALIGTAAALGITVIEPAGNGKTPVVDTFAPGELPSTATVSPAGAILVGASQTTQRPLGASNTGALLDCFAYGEDVASLSYMPEAARTHLTDDFSGTSSASAIVAGAALAAQGLYRATNSRTLSPARLRERLRETGTPAKDALGAEVSNVIGVMPNLARFAERIGRAPVYFQDFPGHNGQSHSDDTMSSPDIFVGLTPLAGDPLAEFTLVGGRASDGTVPIAELVRGQEMFFTVRLASRGGAPLPNFSIALFALPEPLDASAVWLPLGEIAIPELIANAVTVSAPLRWPVPAELASMSRIVAKASSPCFPAFMFEPPNVNEGLLPYVQKNPRITFRRCLVRDP